jgi:hypothetical protein
MFASGLRVRHTFTSQIRWRENRQLWAWFWHCLAKLRYITAKVPYNLNKNEIKPNTRPDCCAKNQHQTISIKYLIRKMNFLCCSYENDKKGEREKVYADEMKICFKSINKIDLTAVLSCWLLIIILNFPLF